MWQVYKIQVHMRINDALLLFEFILHLRAFLAGNGIVSDKLELVIASFVNNMHKSTG